MKYRYLIALAASVTGTAFGGLSAPLPEFKTASQLATWRADKAAESAAESAAKSTTEDPAFYTGKPYVASTGGYAFKYRSYNPELARWTSEDPSGFPDGANNALYVSNSPGSNYDYLGLTGKSVLIVTINNLFGNGSLDPDGVYNYLDVLVNNYNSEKAFMNAQDSSTANTSASTKYLSDGDIFDKHVVSTMADLLTTGNGYDKVYIITHGKMLNPQTYAFMGPGGDWYFMSAISSINAVMMTCSNAGAGTASGTGATGDVPYSLLVYSAVSEASKYLYE